MSRGGGTGRRIRLKSVRDSSHEGSTPSLGTKIMIIFTKHARNKFEVLKRHKFLITEKQVIKAVENPDLVDKSRWPLLISQRKIDRNHVLRVVYKQEFGIIKIITFYPGRIKQYGK